MTDASTMAVLGGVAFIGLLAGFAIARIIELRDSRDRWKRGYFRETARLRDWAANHPGTPASPPDFTVNGEPIA